MSNNKQSSVEWLFEQYKLIGMLTPAQFEKAKAMHEKETIDFAEKAVRMVLNEDIQNPVSINQLYNEIFNK